MPKETMFQKNAGSQVGKKRRIMRELVIKEISAVDVPAQEGATAVIMKRKDDPSYRGGKKKKPKTSKKSQTDEEFDVEKGAALTSEDDGHTHLLNLTNFDGDDRNSGETSWIWDGDEGHSHPWIRMPNGEIIIGASDDHTHNVAGMSKTAEEDEHANLSKDDASNNDDASNGVDGNEEETHMTVKNENGTEQTVEALQAELDKANSIASMNDAAKAHYKSLEGDAASAFLAKSADAQKAELDGISKAAMDNDPVEYTTMDGVELRKSAGVAMIAMAKSNDVIRKENADLKATQANTDLEKRAEAELGHIPGNLATRVSLLKSVDGIEDTAQREAAMNALKAQNDAMALTVKTYGHAGAAPVEGSPDAELETLAKAHQDKNPGMTEEQAFAAVLKTAKGSELYNKSLN